MCSMFRVHVLNGRCQCVTANVKRFTKVEIKPLKNGHNTTRLIAIAISIARARAITVAWMDMQSARKKMCSKNLWWARCVCEYQSPSCFCTLFANFPVYAFGYSIGYFQLHFSLLYVLFCATKKKRNKKQQQHKICTFSLPLISGQCVCDDWNVLTTFFFCPNYQHCKCCRLSISLLIWLLKFWLTDGLAVFVLFTIIIVITIEVTLKWMVHSRHNQNECRDATNTDITHTMHFA